MDFWYKTQTDFYPSEEEMAEARAAYERDEAEREERGERRLADIPDEDIPF